MTKMIRAKETFDTNDAQDTFTSIFHILKLIHNLTQNNCLGIWESGNRGKSSDESGNPGKTSGESGNRGKTSDESGNQLVQES